MAKLSKELLGLAGEYAVASELCRHGLYAQITLGHHKQTDILVESEYKMTRIEVKSKQASTWPGVPGLYREDDFLVLVDFQKIDPGDTPDFYILDLSDWKLLMQEEKALNPSAKVDSRFRITYPDDWTGLNLKPERVFEMKDQCEKITGAVKTPADG